MDVTLQHEGVKISVPYGPYQDDGIPNAQAIADYTSLISKLDDLRRFAASKLLGLYNDRWIDNEIGHVDVNGFIARLTEPSIDLGDEIGSAFIYFKDGGLFAGHHIEIMVNHGTPTTATLIG